MATLARDPFDALVRANHGALVAFATRLTGNAAEAHDVVQDAFERALKGFGRLTPESNARAWLFTIVNNAFIDRCRARAAAPRTESSEMVDPAASEKRPPPLSTRVTAEQLRAAIEQLEPEFRAVYVKHALEERSYQEVATDLGIPVNTVGTRLARARKKLRGILLAMVGEDLERSAEGGET
jgi:RNA polymerase sigma-70 factor (ECF subfamily)